MTPITYTEISPLQFEDQALYLIEGTLSELQTARTTINLLEKIDSNIKAKSMVASAAAVLGGMHGMVANSAAIALHDGEETYHFAGALDGQVICGTFQHAENIKDGDRVKVVVSKRGDVLFTHAILNIKTQEFYMPMNVFSSSDGLFRHCMRVAFWFTLFGWVIFAAGAIFTGVFSTPNTPDDSLADKLKLALMFFLLPPLLMFPFEYWTYRSMRGDKSQESDSYASAIFKVFGFPQPNKIDLLRHSDLSTGADGGWYAAWRVDKLLDKLKA
ncbi:MAG: putative type VI secretion system effector [Rhizobacter sp.]